MVRFRCLRDEYTCFLLLNALLEKSSRKQVCLYNRHYCGGGHLRSVAGAHWSWSCGATREPGEYEKHRKLLKAAFTEKVHGTVGLQVLKMASNGLGMRAGRGPSCVLICLVVLVITLFYSYWGVSSKNSTLLKEVSVLEDRMRTLAARKLTSDKKSSALTSELTKLQKEKSKLGETLKSQVLQVEETSKQLSEKENELLKLHEQEVRHLYKLSLFIIRVA